MKRTNHILTLVLAPTVLGVPLSAEHQLPTAENVPAGAESRVIAKICGEPVPEDSMMLSRFEFSSSSGFACVERLLSELHRMTVPGADVRVVEENLLWNLVAVLDRLKDPALLDRVHDILLTIAMNRTHPLQGQSWLALSMRCEAVTSANCASLGKLDTLDAFSNEEPRFRKLLSDVGADNVSSCKAFVAAKGGHLRYRRARVWLLSRYFSVLLKAARRPYDIGRVLDALEECPEELISAVVNKNRSAGLTSASSGTTHTGSAGLTTLIEALPAMHFSLQGEKCAGECECDVLEPIKGYELAYDGGSLGCEYRGDGGETSRAAFGPVSAKTRRYTGGVFYEGSIDSYVRGGYRNKGLFVEGGNRESRVNYELLGEANLAKCDTVAACFPRLHVGLSRVPDSPTSLVVTVAQGGAKEQISGFAVLDLTKGAAKLTLEARRAAAHRGASGAAPTVTQRFVVSLSPPLDILGVKQNDPMAALVLQLYRYRAAPEDPDKYVPYGEILTSAPGLNGILAERYRSLYIRLLFIQLLQTPTMTRFLTASEHQSLRMAKAVLSDIGAGRYKNNVELLYRDREELLSRIEPLSLDLAIGHLISGKPITQLPDAGLDESIRVLKGATRENSAEWFIALENELENARLADHDLAALLALLDFRRGYDELASRLQDESQLLASEVADFRR